MVTRNDKALYAVLVKLVHQNQRKTCKMSKNARLVFARNVIVIHIRGSG